MIIVVSENSTGKIELSKDELENLINKSYDDGYTQGRKDGINTNYCKWNDYDWWKTAPRYDFTCTGDNDSVKPSVTTAGTYPDNPYNVTTVPLNVDGKSTIYCNGGIYSMDTETPVSNTTTTSASTFVRDTMTGKIPTNKEEFNYQDYINKVKKLRENKKK